jgi:hypothetical protein
VTSVPRGRSGSTIEPLTSLPEPAKVDKAGFEAVEDGRGTVRSVTGLCRRVATLAHEIRCRRVADELDRRVDVFNGADTTIATHGRSPAEPEVTRAVRN